MSDSLVHFGILGCANIARKNIKAIAEAHESCKLVAIASRNLERAQKYAIENQLDASSVTIYGCYQALLDDSNVHAVYLPLPTTQHLEWVTKAAQRGKHILLEKPVASSAEEFLVFYRECERQGVLLLDGTMYMHNPRTDRLLRHLRASPSGGGAGAGAGGNRVARVQSSFSFHGDKDFFASDIRCSSTADPFGALGDLG
jgi:predicted dehydrogenase